MQPLGEKVAPQAPWPLPPKEAVFAHPPKGCSPAEERKEEAEEEQQVFTTTAWKLQEFIMTWKLFWTMEILQI